MSTWQEGTTPSGFQAICYSANGFTANVWGGPEPDLYAFTVRDDSGIYYDVGYCKTQDRACERAIKTMGKLP